MTQASALARLSHVIAMTADGLNCWVEGTWKHEPTIQKHQKEVLTT